MPTGRFLLKLFFSTIFFLVLLEASLQILIYFINNSKTYPAINETANFIQRVKLDSHFEVTLGNQQNFEILCFGDSFTNGGNLSSGHSYPYVLWELYNKKYTVRNMGICESPTAVTFNNIFHFLKSDDFDSSKRYVFAVLTGGADFFSDNLKIAPDSALSSKDTLPWAFLGNNENSFFGKIKSLGLARVIWDAIIYVDWYYLKQHLWSSSEQDQKLYVEISKCFDTFDDRSLKVCLDRMSVKEHQVYPLYKNYSIQYKIKSSQKIRLLKHLVESWPSIISQDERMLTELLVTVQTQSRYTQEEISKTLTTIKKSSIRINKNNQEIIDNYLTWYNKFDAIRDYKMLYLQSIIDLVKNYKNVKLIFMTYPIDHKESNEIIKMMSERNSIKLLDLNQIFSKKIKNKNDYYFYIDDWEHCTSKGYHLIATSLKEKIELLNSEN